MPGIEAVVPVVHRDLPRFRILARSLERHLEDLDRLWIVVPDRQLDSIRAALEVETLFDRHRAEVVSEGRWVPELRRFPHLKGWYRQQLIKLAAADHVASPFYLTLDADVVCCRRLKAVELLIDGRAPCTILNEDSHPDWYRNSSEVLGLPLSRTGILHSVTPALLASSAVKELTRHLHARARDGQWSSGWRSLMQRAFVGRRNPLPSTDNGLWRTYLAASAPWTEYALYYTFLEATGRFGQYHYESQTCIYSVSGSIWCTRRQSLDRWDPEPLFRGSGPPYFFIIQSRTRIDPTRIEDKLRPFLE